MSQPIPPTPAGPPPHPGGYLPHPSAYQNPYAGHPAYAVPPAPAPQPAGLNPWVAGLLGFLIGGFLTFVATMVLPMLFFGFLIGGPFGGEFEEGFMGPPGGRVVVAADGSVSGVALAEELEGVAYYEDVTCPETAKVATDVTTICEGDDGFEGLRIVVVFDGTDGRFSTADLWE